MGIQGRENGVLRRGNKMQVYHFICVVCVPLEYINSFIYHGTIIRNLNYF